MDPLPDRFRYPAGEDTGSAWIGPDTYEWTVEAYNGAGQLLSESLQTRTFVVAASAAVTGQRVALEGVPSGSPSHLVRQGARPVAPDGRPAVHGVARHPGPPVGPEPNAALYKVWISRDQQLTNVIDWYATDQSMFIPTNALIDSQAGSAFYWHVQPCRSLLNCRSLEHAKHAFNKISNPVELLTPTQDSSFANSVTFTWRDYLQTNVAAPRDASGVGSVAADVEAMTYRVQVDDDPNFQSPLETAVVDQTTYTSPGTTYPEGPLYWRVQANDGSNNPLTWSTPGRFSKRSPAVTLSSPTGDRTTSGSEPAALGAARVRGALRGRGLQERRHHRPERQPGLQRQQQANGDHAADAVRGQPHVLYVAGTAPRRRQPARAVERARGAGRALPGGRPGADAHRAAAGHPAAGQRPALLLDRRGRRGRVPLRATAGRRVGCGRSSQDPGSRVGPVPGR